MNIFQDYGYCLNIQIIKDELELIVNSNYEQLFNHYNDMSLCEQVIM